MGKNLLLLLVALAAQPAIGAALTDWGSLNSSVRNTVPGSLEVFKGQGTNLLYPLEVDQTNGALPVEIVSGGGGGSNAAAGPTGSSVPADADYQGLNNGGTLIGAVGDSSGRTIVVGPGTAGTSTGGVLSVQGVASGMALPISAAALPLPTGASTAAKQPALGTAGTASADVITVQGIASMTPLLVTQSGTGTTQPTNITQFGGTNVSTGTGAGGAGIPRVTVSSDSSITNISGTVSLPTGASTSALQTTGNTSLGSIDTKTPSLGQAVMASSSPVVIASNQSAIPVAVSSSSTGHASALVFTNINSSVNITTSAYTQVTASTSANINLLYISDTSGQGFFVATGAAASEVNVLVVPPGGLDSPYLLAVPSGTRLSVKAYTANMTVGNLYIVGLN